MARDGQETYRSGGGRVSGVVGLIATAAVAVLVLADYPAGGWKILLGCAFVALGIWTVLLRPVVVLSGDRVLLRGIVSEVSLPLAAVEGVVISQFVVVRAGGRSWSSPGVGRNRRQIARLGGAPTSPDPTDTYTGVVANQLVARLEQRAEDERAKLGIAAMSDEQFALADDVRRAWSWPLIAVLAVLGLGVLVSAVV